MGGNKGHSFLRSKPPKDAQKAITAAAITRGMSPLCSQLLNGAHICSQSSTPRVWRPSRAPSASSLRSSGILFVAAARHYITPLTRCKDVTSACASLRRFRGVIMLLPSRQQNGNYNAAQSRKKEVKCMLSSYEKSVVKKYNAGNWSERVRVNIDDKRILVLCEMVSYVMGIADRFERHPERYLVAVINVFDNDILAVDTFAAEFPAVRKMQKYACEYIDLHAMAFQHYNLP